MNANPGLFGLAPQGVFHAADVAADAVSSYLAFSPLPPVASNRGGLFSVALSVPVILVKWPGPGRYPAWFPVELGLSSLGTQGAESDRSILHHHFKERNL